MLCDVSLSVRSSQQAAVVFKVILEVMVRIVLTIIIAPLPLALYRDFKAAFQDHLDGQSISGPIERAPIFTAHPRDSLAGPTRARSHPI